MAINYQVKQGDCISSIAFENGFFADTIWNHPNNAELKQKRKDPNVLMPGDVVFVPDLREKEVSEPTNQVHKFRVKNAPAKLNLVIKYYDEPLRKAPYILDIDGKKSEGKTDNDGKISISIPPNAKKGKLTVSEKGIQVEYVLDLGVIDPIDEVKGFKKRLQNLGYAVGKVDNEINEAFQSVIRAFETENKLEPTGEINDKNKNKLKELYGK